MQTQIDTILFLYQFVFVISNLNKTPKLPKFQKLRNKGVARTELSKLLAKGTINRISRGYYRFTESDFTDEKMLKKLKATLRDS